MINTNKIRMIAGRETNFVFHMLSVAQCGYDNAYGQKHRRAYPAQVLETLKKHERLITVEGGEHCGALYSLLVCLPAQGKGSAKAFFQEIIRSAQRGDVPEYYRQRHLDGPAVEIAAAMVQGYDHYVTNVWPEDEKNIRAYIAGVMPLFECGDFTARAEQAVGCALPVDTFFASMVASVEHGAEAIDISEDQDVFGIGRSPEDAFRFIGHEFIIYLLKHALRNEDAFQGPETWAMTEGLAEYYLKKVPGCGCFGGSQKYVDFYETCARDGVLSAAALYRKARAAL